MYEQICEDVNWPTGTPVITHDIWQRFNVQHLTDGTVRELYGKVNGTTGDVRVIEYKIAIEPIY